MELNEYQRQAMVTKKDWESINSELRRLYQLRGIKEN